MAVSNFEWHKAIEFVTGLGLIELKVQYVRISVENIQKITNQQNVKK